MLRLTLVFWLGVVAGKVAFLIRVEIRDFTNVTPLLLYLRDISGVDIGGQNVLFLLLSMFPPLTPEPLLLILLVVLLKLLRRIIT